MSNIVVLDELTINKIAAGEVIERPASVIKEMVENSIDAGAKNINIEIKNGGISLIRVTDDGKGIEKDDMELSFERHATSKIRQAEDLNEIRTMGFRGEALASIAAIAKVQMISKTQDSEIGNRIVVEGGNVLEMSEIGAPNGTSITVENLFYNTPVRYKFLKKDYTESGYIEDVVTRLALIHPDIAFKFMNSGKTIIQTSGDGDLKNVIYNIYGKTVASACLNVNYTYEGIEVTGVVGKPEIARSNRGNQLFFVNQRYIKDKILSNATEKAFKGMIPIGKFGFVVLNIEMEPSKVDVNVHPAKLEVRFEEEQKVFKAVYYAIQETLLKAELIANSETKITGKIEKDIDNEGTENNTVEKNSITGLFRRIARNSEPENSYDNNNLIESIYNSKQGIMQVNEEKELMPKQETRVENADDGKEETEQEIKDMNNKEQIQNTIDELMKMGQSLTPEQIRNRISSISTNNMDDTKEQILKESDEKYDTKPIDTGNSNIVVSNNQESNNIFENNELAAGNILANIAQERSKKEFEETTEDDEKEFDDMYEQVFGKALDGRRTNTEEVRKDAAIDIINNNVNIFEENEDFKNQIPYKFIGIAFSTYIILEIEDELYILDQHAAHERIMYEKVKKNYYSKDGKDSQLMLLPDIITLTHKEMDIARDNKDKFEKAGFVFEEFGENTIKLTGVPNICLDLDTKDLFLETLDEINSVARTAKQEIEERFIATIACKAAVKANMALTEEEVRSLLDQLLKLPNPFTCPHGRPTAIKLSQSDIEKKFARKQ